MDIYFYARAMKEDAMAEAARVKAEQIMNRCSSRSTSGTGKILYKTNFKLWSTFNFINFCIRKGILLRLVYMSLQEKEKVLCIFFHQSFLFSEMYLLVLCQYQSLNVIK
jgi:hypothetical protein